MPAVSVGAGTLWFHAYDAVTTRGGRYVQGGGCATVGVPGLVQGGGFGSFSKRYGMAAASLLEAEVVTADGVVRVANACTHPDLFWALKGGGGPSFGVVTRLTLRTHALPADVRRGADDAPGGLGCGVPAADPPVRGVLRGVADEPALGRAGPARTAQPDGVQMLFEGLDRAQAEEVWRPFLAEARAAERRRHRRRPGRRRRPGARLLESRVPRTKLGPYVRATTGRPRRRSRTSGGRATRRSSGRTGTATSPPGSPRRCSRPARQEALAAALFAASRHWTVGLHFNKGLAGAPPEAIAAAARHCDQPGGARRVCPGDHRRQRAAGVPGRRRPRARSGRGARRRAGDPPRDGRAAEGGARTRGSYVLGEQLLRAEVAAGVLGSELPAAPRDQEASTTRPGCSSSTTGWGARTGARTG